MAINVDTSERAPDSVAAVGDDARAADTAEAIEQQHYVLAKNATVHLNACFGEAGWGVGGSEPHAGWPTFETAARIKLMHKYRKNADMPTVRIGIETYISIAGNTCTTEVLIDGVSLHTFSSTSANNGTPQTIDLTPAGSGWKLVELRQQWTVVSGNPSRGIRRWRIEDVEVTASYPQPIDP